MLKEDEREFVKKNREYWTTHTIGRGTKKGILFWLKVN